MPQDRLLYRGAALADGMGPDLAGDVSVLVEGGRLSGLWLNGEAPESSGAEEVDASGATLVPGMVDSHNHVTMPGGADWIRRGLDPTDKLLAVAEEAGELLVRSGVRWIRDVGSPRRDGRAVSLGVRDAWQGRDDRPSVKSAGTWLAKRGKLPDGLSIALEDGDDLADAAVQQLEEGADLVKLYLDGPDAATAPFTLDEVAAVVSACHARGARVAAHATTRPGILIGAQAAVDSLEHCCDLDADIAATMARNGTALVSTLAVWHSMLSFGTTTTAPRWCDEVETIRGRLARSQESVRIARDAGVVLAAGSDAGGGSCRHGSSLAWEVVALVEAGVPGWEAIAAATWHGGDLLGEPAAGRLVVGGRADAFFVHGDPYRDPTALWRIWRVL